MTCLNYIDSLYITRYDRGLLLSPTSFNSLGLISIPKLKDKKKFGKVDCCTNINRLLSFVPQFKCLHILSACSASGTANPCLKVREIISYTIINIYGPKFYLCYRRLYY